jgi:HEAT repeat protein
LGLPGQKPGDGVTGLVRRLGSTDAWVRHDAFVQLCDHKTAEVFTLLREALPGYPYKSQSLGFTLLQGFPVEQSAAATRGFLRGAPSYLRFVAAMTLYPGDRSLEPHLVTCLTELREDGVRTAMIDWLWDVDAAPVSRAVVACLTSTASPTLFGSALGMLSRVKTPMAVDVVDGLLAGGLDPDRRALCAGYLVVMGERSGVAPLVAAIPEVKQFERLGMVLGVASHLDEAVLAAVLEFAGTRRGHEVRSALELLARHEYRPGVKMMRELLQSDDAVVCKAAFDALMRMDEGLPHKVLLGLLAPSHSIPVRMAAADALRRLDDHAGLPRLIEMIGKELGSDPQGRGAAVAALGKFRSRDAVPALLDALADSDQGVRSQGLQGLRTVLSALFPYRRFDLSTTGYTADGPAVQRAAGLAKLRGWWAAQQRGG